MSIKRVFEIALSLQLAFRKHLDSGEVYMKGSLGQFTPGHSISVESVTKKKLRSKGISLWFSFVTFVGQTWEFYNKHEYNKGVQGHDL